MPAGNKRRTSKYGVYQNSDHILTINKNAYGTHMQTIKQSK